jgi:RimJ/RimL family protein N-acetyltransferase
VRLRRATAEDAEFFDRLHNQPSSLRFQASPKRSMDEVQALLAQQAAVELGPKAVAKFYWVIQTDGVESGILQLDVNAGFRQQDNSTMGYTVDEAMQGRGVATAAVREAIRIAFGEGGLGLERIEAVAAVENTASRRVLEKSGFHFEGVRRGLLRIQGQRVDHACYGILKSDLAYGGL